MGEACFTGPHALEVRLLDGGIRSLSAERIVISAGVGPAIPDLPGLSEVPYLTSTTVMEIDTVPEHLVVVGGGYVAVEFAQMFRRFGGTVTIVQRSGQLLGQEDADVAEEVTAILRRSGVEVLLDSVVRTPNTDALDLTAAGVEVDGRGFIKTNERLETNVAGVCAAGDIKGGPAFTHISYDDFRVLRTNLLDVRLLAGVVVHGLEV